MFKQTGGKQKPGEYTELMGDVYLAGFDASAPVQQAVYTPPVRQENRNNTGDRTYRVNGVSFTMKPIAAVQGAVLGDNSLRNNQEHSVSLSAYYIGQTEVTQELWQAVMGSNPSSFTASVKNPVEKVSWYDCIEFCNELTAEIMGEEHCVYTIRGSSVTADFSQKGFRLPTEAEWEYAAMGGRYHTYAGTNNDASLKDYAWYDSNSGGKTHEVGTKQANKYGIYDMSGNVWEWCWDWYSSSTPSGGQSDPTGAASGALRVVRGGSWRNYALLCVVGGRNYNNPVISFVYLGFRLALRP